MKKTMKKLLCLTLTLIMCLMSLPVVSLASEDAELCLDISQQRAIIQNLEDTNIKIIGINMKLDLSSLYDYFDITVECIDANGVSYYQTIDVSEEADDLVELSFDTTAPAKRFIVHFNSLSELKANVLTAEFDIIDTDFISGFALLSDEFGSKLFTAAEAEIIEEFVVNVPINLMYLNVGAEAEFKSVQYVLDVYTENITVDISDALAIKKALDEVDDINVIGLVLDPDFSNFYHYLDVTVECIDENGNSSTKIIDVSEAESNLVELDFSTTAPAKQFVIHFNGIEKVTGNILSTSMVVLELSQFQGFTISSETFGSRTFTHSDAEDGEEFVGAFKFDLSTMSADAEARMKSTRYVLDVYNETVTVNVCTPRAMKAVLDDIKVRGLSLNFTDFYKNLDVTVECIDANGISTSKLIDISETTSDLVDLTFSTTAPVRKIILHFNSIKKMTLDSIITGNIELFSMDDLFEFAIDTDAVGSKLFTQDQAQQITDCSEQFKLNVSGINMAGVAQMQSAQYVFDYCQETVSLDISAYKEMWDSLDNVDTGTIDFDFTDLAAKASDIEVICTDINGATSTQSVNAVASEEDVVNFTFSMDAPVKNITLRLKSLREIDLMGITSITGDYFTGLALNTRMGTRFFINENAKRGEMLSVKFKMKISFGSVNLTAAVQNVEYSFDFAKEYYPESYRHEADSFSFGNFYDTVSEDIYKNAYGEVKGAELYKLFENNESHGLCFGMTAATAAFLAHPDAISSENTYSYVISDLATGSIPDAFGTDIETFIKYAHIYQFDGDVQKAERAAMNNVSGLYEAVKAYVNGNNQPVVINFFGKDDEALTQGHSVIAIGFKETEDYYMVLVRDYDVYSDKQELKIAKDFSSWSYNALTNEDSDITYLLPADKIYEAGKKITTQTGFFGADESLVTSTKAIAADSELQAVLPVVAGSAEGEDEGVYAYWLEDEELATVTSLEEDNVISVYGDKSSVEVVLDENDEATVNVDILDNSKVILKTADNEIGKIIFTTVDENGETAVLEIEGSDCEGTVTATKNDEGITVSGIKDGKVTLSEDGTVVASQEITMAESDIDISLDSEAGLDVDYTAHGHSYEQTVTLAPTHISEGVMTYNCSCGDSYTEDIGVIQQHSYNASTVKPTCTQNGYTEYTCQCGDTYTETIPTMGHTYKDGETKCSDCGFDKADNCSCNCHKSGIMSFIWKIINLFNKLFKINGSCSCGVRHW